MAEAPHSVGISDQEGGTEHAGKVISGKFYPACIVASSTGDIDGGFSVSGPLTDAQLRATAVPVSGAFYQATQPVSAASLPLPSGAATSAKQDLLLAELQLKADLTETQPVSLASVPTHEVTGTFWQATQPVSAVSLPLPSGAATSAAQTTAQTALDAIKTALEILDNVVAGSEAQVDIVAALPTGSNVIGGVTQSGTWTVQPGNTANTTAWLVAQKTPAALTVKSAKITVGTTAVRMTTDGNAPSADRAFLFGQPDKNSGARFFFGPSSVTSSGATMGGEIYAGVPFISNYDAGDYYVISDTAGQDFYVVERET